MSKNLFISAWQKVKSIPRMWKIILGVVLIVLGGYIIYHIQTSKNNSTTYQTAEASKGTLTVSVSGTGNIAVDKRSSVSPGITGEVYDLSVKLGDTVTEGQLLFKLDNDQLDTQVASAYSSYLQAKQNYENSVAQLLQAQKNQSDTANKPSATDEEKNIANQQVNSAQMAVEAAKQKIESSWNDYELAKENAAKRTVTAPINGTITSLNVTEGDQLGSSSNSSSNQSSSSTGQSSSNSSTSSSAAIVIDDLSSMKASVSINEVDASKVKTGQKASMTFDAIDGLEITGKVEQISTIGTETSGVVTYPATISFDSLDERLKPQMSLTATITTDVKQDVLMVPNAAVKSSNSVSYVQVMKNGSPQKQTVEIGASNDSYTEITNGLSAGDVVVTQTITKSSKSASSSSSNSSNKSNSNNTSSLRGLTGGGGFSGPPGN